MNFRAWRMCNNAVEAWSDQVDISIDIFLKEHPFLEDLSREAIIIDFESEREESDIKLLHMHKQIKTFWEEATNKRLSQERPIQGNFLSETEIFDEVDNDV